MRTQALTNSALALTFALTIAACGGDDTPNNPSDPGTTAATITITANGLSPTSVTVPAGSRVTFQNNDTRGHGPASNPHPSHGSCPPIDQVGTIAAGQSRATGNLNTPGTCSFHDHDTDAAPRYNGTIIVQ
jgi:plastocyanin